uniref:Biotin/lipoyl-binding protein n=1 Tax=Ammonifex degensii TaxID=42838 RepID=A0A7C2IQY6_9THEO
MKNTCSKFSSMSWRTGKRHEKASLPKQAGFYVLKTFDGYCFNEIRIPSGLSIDNLKDASFIEERRNFILYGAEGDRVKPGVVLARLDDAAARLQLAQAEGALAAAEARLAPRDSAGQNTLQM